jgi:hypothetical protein
MGVRSGALALVVACAVVSVVSCGRRPERSTAEEFFDASRLRDKTALAHMATVTFEPLENGIVESFEISKVSKLDDNTKTVSVTAKVRMPGDAGVVQKIVLLTLARGALKNDPAAAGRWIVTGFIERAAGPPATPPPQ